MTKTTLTRTWEVSLWLLRKIAIKSKYFEYLEPDIIVEPLSVKKKCISFLHIFRQFKDLFIYLSVSFLKSLILDSWDTLQLNAIQVDVYTDVLYENAAFMYFFFIPVFIITLPKYTIGHRFKQGHHPLIDSPNNATVN